MTSEPGPGTIAADGPSRGGLTVPRPILLLLLVGLAGCLSGPSSVGEEPGPPPFAGVKAGDERDVAGVRLCWCSPGKFVMGSPPNEPGRRPGEDQVEDTLTQGSWVGKYEVKQGQWWRVAGEFPDKLTAGQGDDFPAYNVNHAEAKESCRKLTEQARESGELPKEWQFRLPTEGQWEYALTRGSATRHNRRACSGP